MTGPGRRTGDRKGSETNRIDGRELRERDRKRRTDAKREGRGGGVGEIGKPPFVGRQTTAEQWRAMAGKSVQFEIHVASAKPFKGEDLHL